MVQIQASVALNQQWVLIEGVSETSLDAELWCRLSAQAKIAERAKPRSGGQSTVDPSSAVRSYLRFGPIL